MTATPAELEFGADPEVPAAPETPTPSSVVDHTADIAALQGANAKLAQELEGMRSTAGIVGRLQEVFGGKPSDPKDVFVRSEIQRLVPELDDIAKIKELLPQILVTLQAAAEEGTVAKAASAQDLMKGMMQDIGIDPKDEEAVADLEEVLTREIKRDKQLMGLWARGNVKGAVTKAFEKVQGRLFAPVRANTKRSAVQTITNAPRTVPRGGAPTPPAAGKPKLDLSDTSRDGVKKIHDAAFERLQELLGE